MAFHHSPRIVTDGLVLSLDAADKNSYIGSGTTWTDLSTSGTDGTLSAAAIGTDVLGSMDFDGSSEYVTVATMSDSTTLSVEMWINPDNTTARAFLLNSGDFDINIDVHSNGMRINRNNANHPRYTNPTVGAWTHFVVTAPNKTTDPIIYFNGILQTGSDADYGTILGSTTNIGTYSAAAPQAYYDGKISSVKIYNRALSAKEVSQNFNAQRHRFGV